MSSNELHIELESFDNAFLITPVGDVDLSQSDQLRQVIKDSIESANIEIFIFSFFLKLYFKTELIFKSIEILCKKFF